MVIGVVLNALVTKQKACTYSGPSGTENKGICKAGTQTCSNGQWARVWRSPAGQHRRPVEIILITICDGNTDEGCVVCEDKDGDGYYGYNSVSCSGRDCNDSDNGIPIPGATEACNTIDDNCGPKRRDMYGRLMQQYVIRLNSQSRKRESLP